MNQDQINAKLSQINSKGLEASFTLSEAALEKAQKLAFEMIKEFGIVH